MKYSKLGENRSSSQFLELGQVKDKKYTVTLDGLKDKNLSEDSYFNFFNKLTLAFDRYDY